MTLPINEIICGDCLDVMPTMPDKSIDMILCDLPYGTTACKWDTVIPFEPLWEQYERIIKDNGAIVLFGMQPFTSALIMSNPAIFKYQWVWQKDAGTGFGNANKQPLRDHEDIAVFYYKQPTYNPQFSYGTPYKQKSCGANHRSSVYAGGGLNPIETENNGTRFPKTVLKFARDKNKCHPTQKPVALCEYLIKTYTNKGEIVLDNCIGGGTTAIAALNAGRFFIGIEKEEKYVEIARKRIAEHTQQLSIV